MKLYRPDLVIPYQKKKKRAKDTIYDVLMVLVMIAIIVLLFIPSIAS